MSYMSLIISDLKEYNLTGSDDKDTAIGLRSSSDHVLDEIPVSWSINDGDIVLRGFELPESDINGNSTLTFGLQFVKNPCVLEGSLTHLDRK